MNHLRARRSHSGWPSQRIRVGTVQGVAIVMVGYRYAIEHWVKPMAEKRRAERREEGRAEVNRQWMEWLQRKTETESKGGSVPI